MTDYSELKRLALNCRTERCADESEQARNEREFLLGVDHEEILALIAEGERLRADYAALSTFNPDWDRVAAAQDSVREHMELANQLKAVNFDYQLGADAAKDEIARLKAEIAGLRTGYEAFEQVNTGLKAECEGLRATADLQKLLTELDDALEELELHGRHSDQGYRKLKDWYRKVVLAYRVIQGPMFGAEHGELVSQNTWLRSVVEHYGQQHAPVEPIPDMEGWSARLPGYDLPALLRDAERYRWLRAQQWNDSSLFVVAGGRDSVRLGIDCPSADRLDIAIDAAKAVAHG